MSEIKPRKQLTEYTVKYSGENVEINRIELYRNNKRKWYQFWRPKYEEHYLALTDNGIYELFTDEHPEHEPLFERSEI